MASTDGYPIESARCLEHEKDLDRLAMSIEAQMSHARERKWTRALSWFRNAAFMAGHHLDTFRYSQGTFTQDTVVIPPRLSEVMSPHNVDNHVLRIVQANIAELTGMNPYPDIEPASLSPDDIDLSKIGELSLSVLWEKPLRVPEKLRVLVGYLAITGTAAAEVYFGGLGTFREQMARVKIKVPDLTTGEEVDDWAESPTKTEWAERQGLRMRIWSGFHIDVNPDATSDPDTVTWVSRTTFEDVESMRRMFGRSDPGFHKKAVENLGPSEHSDDPLWHWEQIKDLIDSPEGYPHAGVQRGVRRTLAQCTRVRVIDTRPTEEFPMGRTIVTVGGKVAYSGPSRSWTEEYPERWTPMQITRWWTLPGRFEGIPLISPLVPLQKRINALHTIIRMNRQHMGVGAWLIPERANVPKGFIGPTAGQNITYRPGPRGEKPERVQFQALTVDIFEELAGCIAAMERIGGIAGAQLQSSPSALRAASMLDFSQRQAQQSKSAVLLDFEAFVGDLAQAILCEVARNMSDDPELLRRVAVAARAEGDLAIERFKTLDLRDNVRVRIDLRSQWMQTPEARRETAGQFLQYSGQNMTPSERAKVAQVMGLTELDMQVSQQWKRARRMVERVMGGMVDAAIPLDGVDDPGIFAEVVRDAMLTERALIAAPDVKNALQTLMDHYGAAVAAKAQAIAASLPQGGNSSAPIASPPPSGQNGV